MSTILKEDVLHEKKTEIAGKEKVDKVMDTIVESQGAVNQSQSENVGKTLEQKKPAENDSKQHIFSGEVLIEGENADELHEIRERLRKELKPTSEIESIIVDRMVSSIWRLKRCLKIESQLLEYSASCIQEYEQGFFKTRKRTNKELTQLKALRMVENKKRIEELSVQETILERQIYKALGELDKLRNRESRQERKVLRRSK